MALIKISNLTFHYEGSHENIFENASFQFDTDWKLGFAGRNGRGKTTFLQLLLGRYEYGGTITAPLAFEYFPFSVENPGLPALQVAEAIVGPGPAWALRRELSLLAVAQEAWARPFYTLSGGERTKVLLAALFLKEHRFLLIDEPTDHLDLEARSRVAGYLNSKKGFVLVSHDRAFLDGCVDHMLVLNKASLEVVAGNFSTWWQNKTRQDQYEMNQNQQLRRDIRHLSEAAGRAAHWSDRVEKSKRGQSHGDKGYIGHQAARMMKRAKAIETRKEAAALEKTKLLKNIETVADLRLNPLPYHSRRLAWLREAVAGYKGRPVTRPLSLEISQGDRIALWGRNGTGKSTLLKLLRELAVPNPTPGGPDGPPPEAEAAPELLSGSVKLGGGLILSYVPQDTGSLRGTLAGFIADNGLEEALFKAVLRRLDFSREQFDKPLEEYSAGQRKKICLAKSLCLPAHLYLWDEPLNFIDVFSRMQIRDLLLAYGPTLLFVEHDTAFAEEIATRRVVLE
jgi:lincosamide and streptogramin A transport system ATP-binding/permease protein